MFGYKDWRDLYTEYCINGKLHKVKVPTLILNAEDDPFAPPNCKLYELVLDIHVIVPLLLLLLFPQLIINWKEN